MSNQTASFERCSMPKQSTFASWARPGITTCEKRCASDLDEGVRMVGESVAFLKSHGRRVFFDAEHFFDGYQSDPSFALAVLTAANEAGAERLVLCDTNGGTLPTTTDLVIADVQASFPDTAIGVHYHNDGGTAVAASISAVEAGVTQIQGCINGYGERTGNADLSTLIPDLQLKKGLTTDSGRSWVTDIHLPPHRGDCQHFA